MVGVRGAWAAWKRGVQGAEDAGLRGLAGAVRLWACDGARRRGAQRGG